MDDATGKHPEKEQMDAELFLQLLERFGGVPFRRGKHALTLCGRGYCLKWKMSTFVGQDSEADGGTKRVGRWKKTAHWRVATEVLATARHRRD